MKTANVTEAKNRLSALIDQVRTGETILILDRGLPVARLEPVAAHTDQAGRIARLERAGIVRVARELPPLDLLAQPAPPLPDGSSIVRTLIEERRSAR